MARISQKNIIDVPVNCPPGQKPDQNGRCRPVFSSALLDRFYTDCLGLSEPLAIKNCKERVLINLKLRI